MHTTKRFALWFIALALILGLAGSASAQKESKAVMEARKLDQQLIEAFNARNADGVMAQYWNDPGLFASNELGEAIRGFAANRKASQEFLGGAQSIQLTTSDWNYWDLGNSVLANCAYVLKVKQKDGSSFEGRGRYTSVRRKVGSNWPIVFEHVGSNPPAPPAATDPLYKRLGGYDAIAAVTDDFLGRLAADQRLGSFFKGVSKAHLNRIRQHVVDFLCQATGGPCVYAGADMKSTHVGLGITNADWDRMVGFLVQTFDKFGVPDRERKELLGALGGLKGDIVDKP